MASPNHRPDQPREQAPRRTISIGSRRRRPDRLLRLAFRHDEPETARREAAQTARPAPEAGRPFRALHRRVRFPETPPYGGAHPGSTPHLTIGHDAPRPLLERAAEGVSDHLPIQGAVPSVHLISGSPEPGSWRTVTEFPLGDGRPGRG